MIILDVNVWMGGTANAKAHYMNIVKMTKNAIRNGGLPHRSHAADDQDSVRLPRRDAVALREEQPAHPRGELGESMPLFGFDKLWKEHGLDPTRALRRDGIHQMPDTALFEIRKACMLDFIARHHGELAIEAAAAVIASARNRDWGYSGFTQSAQPTGRRNAPDGGRRRRQKRAPRRHLRNT